MKHKEIYNLLAVTTVLPVLLDSTNGTEVFGPIHNNEYAHNGRIYFDFQGFSVPTGTGFVPILYASWNGYTWKKSTAFPTYTTAGGGLLELTNLPRYFRLGWEVNAEEIASARFMLEADAEY